MLNEEERTSILSIYLRACTAEDATHRLECAYNLPAVVYCQGVKHFIASNMAETIKLLSEDSDELVRQKVALGFHEVCQTLGETSLNMLQETMTHLLEDASTKVSLAMYSKLAPILHIWSQRGRVPLFSVFFDDVSNATRKADAIVNDRSIQRCTLICCSRKNRSMCCHNRCNGDITTTCSCN